MRELRLLTVVSEILPGQWRPSDLLIERILPSLKLFIVGTPTPCKVGKLLARLRGKSYGSFRLDGQFSGDKTWKYSVVHVATEAAEIAFDAELQAAEKDAGMTLEDAAKFHEHMDAGRIGRATAVVEKAPERLEAKHAEQKATDDKQSVEYQAYKIELAKKNEAQRRALKIRDDAPPVSGIHDYKEYREPVKPMKWKAGGRGFMRGQWGTFGGTPDNKIWISDDYEPGTGNGLMLEVVETAKYPKGYDPILASFEDMAYQALLRGDDRSLSAIALSQRSWGMGGSIKHWNDAIALRPYSPFGNEE
jgi:hypothetical protein